MPFFILVNYQPQRPNLETLQRTKSFSGLPASGSFDSPRLPINLRQWRYPIRDMRLLSPVTAAGPRRISTVFPAQQKSKITGSPK